jgi:BNR repeat-containing family member
MDEKRRLLIAAGLCAVALVGCSNGAGRAPGGQPPASGGVGGSATSTGGATDDGSARDAVDGGEGGISMAAGTDGSFVDVGRGPSVGGNPTGGSGDAGGRGGMGTPSAVSKDSESLLTDDGLTLVSYGGFMNGESFQQDGVVSDGGYQYAAFWNTRHHVVLTRRLLPSGPWTGLEFTDYTNTADDAHNTISIGICPGDGTLHLSFDHHGSNLHYRKSVVGFVTNPSAWSASSFSAVTSDLVGTTTITQLTYPRFVTEPSGSKMLFEARIGGSGSGDEYLWEYDATVHGWASVGRFINGTTNSVNAYLHGLSYGRAGTRLYASWCWRDTPDATTNHDLLYVYSDDDGRTWKNNTGVTVAVTGSSFITPGSPDIVVWPIGQNRGLINQEHMAIDSMGIVHVLLSHMPDSQPDDANFDSARTKSQFFHYWRSAAGIWTRNAMGFPVVASFRGKLAISSTNSLYAILPDLRIAAPLPASNYSSWVILNAVDSGRFFSDPLIDTARLLVEDKLTIVYPEKSSPNIDALDYSLK